MSKAAKIKVEKSLKKAILKAVDLTGGFKKFIKPGETVLLKPNFNTIETPILLLLTLILGKCHKLKEQGKLAFKQNNLTGVSNLIL